MSISILDRLLGRFADLTSRQTATLVSRWPFLMPVPTLDLDCASTCARATCSTTETNLEPAAPEPLADVRNQRTIDGSHNDLSKPAWMGDGGARASAATFRSPTASARRSPALRSQPAAGQHELASARISCRCRTSPAGARLAAVHGARLAERTATHDPAVKHEFPMPEGRRLARQADVDPEDHAGPAASRRRGRPAAYVNRETHW